MSSPVHRPAYPPAGVDLLACHEALAGALASTCDSLAALRAVCEAVPPLVGCDRVQVWRGDVRQQTMSTLIAVGYGGRDAERLAQLSVPLTGLPVAPDFLERKCLCLGDVRAVGGMGEVLFAPFGIEAAAFLLLERGDRVLGALQLSWCDTSAPAFPSRPVMDVIRRYVGLAVDVHARTDEAVQTASTLADTAMLLTAIHDPDELLEAMAGRITAAVGCDWGAVHLLDEATGRFRYAAGAGSVAALDVQRRVGVSRRKVEQGLATMAENDVIEIPDVAAADHMKPYHVPGEMASLVLLPLRRAGALVGLVTLGYRRRTGRFARRQIALAKGLGHHALAALEGARLVRSLKQANHVKNDFVAAVSHDLRTPLHILIGYNDMLLDGEVGPLGDKQAHLVSRMRECAVRFLEMIDGILEMARLDAGQMSVTRAPIALDELCASLVAEVEDSRRPEVDLRWHVDVPTFVGDAPKIKTILRNLLTNALKFTTAGRVELRCFTTATGELVFHVADSGPGVKPADREQIFQMFRQGDAGRQAGGSGLGLGLYLVRRLAEVLGGSVELASSEPGHTVFEVRLPPSS